MKIQTKLLIGFLAGMVILLVAPIFPIPLHNLNGDSTSMWFVSGIKLLKNGFGIPLFFLFEFISGLFGSFISLFFKSD